MQANPHKTISNNSGFSFTETLITLIFIGFISTTVFYFISVSNRNTMDSYHRYLAEQIAREPLEIFHCIGYRNLEKLVENELPDFRFNVWQPVQNSLVNRPTAAARFARKIQLHKITSSGNNAFFVEVMVRPAASINSNLLQKNEISCSGIVMERQVP
jgi:Tfp pilus assembly protein PilV